MATVKNVKKAIFLIREISAEDEARLSSGVRAGELIDRNTSPDFSDPVPDELRVVFIEGLPAIRPAVAGISVTSVLVDEEDTRTIIAGAGGSKD